METVWQLFTWALYSAQLLVHLPNAPVVGMQLKFTTYVQDTCYPVLFYVSKLIITKHVMNFFCWYLHTFKPHPQLPDLQYWSPFLIEEKYIYCVQKHVSCASSLYTAQICWYLFTLWSLSFLSYSMSLNTFKTTDTEATFILHESIYCKK